MIFYMSENFLDCSLTTDRACIDSLEPSLEIVCQLMYRLLASSSTNLEAD
jgi:hypothetical protein